MDLYNGSQSRGTTMVVKLGDIGGAWGDDPSRLESLMGRIDCDVCEQVRIFLHSA